LGCRPCYERVATRSKVFRPEAAERLAIPPLQQIWFDHLLALSMLQAGDGWQTGRFALLAPSPNAACSNAAEGYAKCLMNGSTFAVWTLEDIVALIAANTDARWARAFADRYLDFDRVNAITNA
jgi:PD-(D/E)XK nuclease superfamily